MTERARRAAFASAFFRQAHSDWRIYRRLAADSKVERCHPLHYLQMACEKLAKAYRLRDTQSPVDSLVSNHGGFEKFVGAFCGMAFKDEYKRRAAQLESLIIYWRRIAREIEKLAPAIDKELAPENAEYPWERDGRITAPCEYSFPALELLHDQGGRGFLKMVERAFEEFENINLP